MDFFSGRSVCVVVVRPFAFEGIISCRKKIKLRNKSNLFLKRSMPSLNPHTSSKNGSSTGNLSNMCSDGRSTQRVMYAARGRKKHMGEKRAAGSANRHAQYANTRKDKGREP